MSHYQQPMFIQRTQKPNRRGFTLVELTMVMAITAIISVMIVSFSTLISAQTRKNNLRADFLESVITLRTDLQKQFADYNYDYNELSKYISGITEDDITIVSTPQEDGKLIKITVTNTKLNESQSFTLLSKVE